MKITLENNSLLSLNLEGLSQKEWSELMESHPVAESCLSYLISPPKWHPWRDKMPDLSTLRITVSCSRAVWKDVKNKSTSFYPVNINLRSIFTEMSEDNFATETSWSISISFSVYISGDLNKAPDGLYQGNSEDKKLTPIDWTTLTNKVWPRLEVFYQSLPPSKDF